MASRSRKSQSGAESSGNASMSCWAVQAAVGCSVKTANCWPERQVLKRDRAVSAGDQR